MKSVLCMILCLALGGAASPSAAQSPYWCWALDAVTAEVEGSTITIHHDNALYNCCHDPFEYSSSQEGNLILVHETEVLVHPCHCLCCFNLSNKIENVQPGEYQIDFSWHDYESGGEEHRSVQVTVPNVSQEGPLIPGQMEASDCLPTPPVDVGDGAENAAFVLYPARPNPAAPTTMIRYRLRDAGPIRLTVFSAAGARVRTLAQGRVVAGMHSVPWDGRNDTGQPVPGGVYFCRLEGPYGAAKRTVILIR